MNEICPRCKKRNLGENRFCENCLCDLTEVRANEFYGRWIF